MMGSMARAELELGMHRVIVSLPPVDPDDLIAACEVLWQEQHRVWSLPVDRLDELAGLLGVFGRRARIGVHNVLLPEEAGAAVEAGAAMLASPVPDAALVAAAGTVSVILGGLTPSELHVGYRAGASAVQVIPCEAFGSAYARGLPPLMAPVPVVASGHLEHYQADLWLSAGALGVWPGDLVTVDLVVDADLDGLRAVAQAWRLGD